MPESRPHTEPLKMVVAGRALNSHADCAHLPKQMFFDSSKSFKSCVKVYSLWDCL